MRAKNTLFQVFTPILGLVALAVVFMMPQTASAVPCTTGTLSDYISLGSTGCQIGDKMFHNFGYSPTSFGGGLLVPATGIAVVPVDNPFLAEIDFNGLFAAGPHQSVDGLISFSVDVLPGGNPIDDLGLSQGGSVVYGTGIASVGETACIGATFPGGCVANGGTIGHLQTVVAFGGVLSTTYDHIQFDPVMHVSVVKDIGVTGGEYGLGLLSHVTNEFSEVPGGGGGGGEVPEPATLASFGTGILGLGFVAYRRRKSSRV